MSMWELLVILLVALVVFSPEQLPTIARSAGRLWRKMQNLSQNLHDELNKHVKEEILQENIKKAKKADELYKA